MAINYNDSRFNQVEQDKQVALNKVNDTYNNIIQQNDQYYDNLANSVQEYGDKQTQLTQQATDLEVERIENEQAKADRDYLKEQKAAYSDYQKASNSYGANAEALASRGLTGSGYAESTMTQMYVEYQNRVGLARQAAHDAKVEYDLAIKDAKLQGSSQLAEIAFNTLQQKLQYALDGFNNKNNLLLQQLSMQQQVDQNYYQRKQDVVSQINTENALAEQQREFNLNYAKSTSRSSGGGSSKSGSSSNNTTSLSDSTNNTKVTTNSTPLLSSAGANKWFNSNLNGKTVTVTDLNKQIATAVSKGTISESDSKKVLLSFGIK